MKYSPATLLILYNLITFAYIWTRGFYSLGSFLALLSAFLAFTFYYFIPSKTTNLKIELEQILKITLALSVFISLVLYGGLYQSHGFIFKISHYLLAVCCLLSLSYFINPQKMLSKYRFKLLFTIAILLQIFMIISSPAPKIDVFDQLKYGSTGLVKGINPYSQVYPQIYNYSQNYFPYLPLTAIVMLPFNLILGDPRFALVTAYIVSALLIRKMLKKNNLLTPELVPLIFLFHPQTTFMIEQAWIDPMIFAFFVIFIYFLTVKKNQMLAGLSLGFAIALKQTFPLLLIFLYTYKKIPRKILAISIVILAVSIIPFYLWNRSDFINDVIKIHIERKLWWHNSLTFNSFFFSEFEKNINQLVFLTAWIVLLGAILKKGITNFSTLSLAISLWFFAFYLFNYQAYIHYYFLISGLILASISLTIRGEERGASYDKK